MNAPELIMEQEEQTKAAGLLSYYEAIEHASQDMLEAARAGDWDRVMRLEGACAVLIAQLKHAASERPLQTEEVQLKGRIMQRILVNDAEIRNLAEPWINDLSRMSSATPDGDALH
jgi:flagellar protein FliT